MRPWLRLCRVPLLVLVGSLLLGLSWLTDDAGRPAPPCTYIDDSVIPNLIITCSKSNPLPSAPGVTAATDPFGFGRQWFFNGLGAPFQTRFALFIDQTTVLSFRGPGGSNLTIDTSPDGGKTFPVGVTVPLPANRFFNGPIIFNPSGAQFLFIGSDNVVAPRIARSTNLTTWTFSAALSDATGTFRAIGVQASTVIVWGQTAGNVAEFCRSADNGATWSACVTIAGSNGPGVSGGRVTVASPAPGIWLLIDSAGRIFRSTNDGVSFALQTTLVGGGGTGGFALLCLSATRCVATATGQMSLTTDAGVTWTTTSRFAFNVDALCLYSTSILVGFNVSASGGLTTQYTGAVVSNDSGNSWSGVAVNGGFAAGGQQINSISCVSSGKAFVSAGDGINFGGWYNPTVAGGGLLIGRTGNAAAVDANGNLTANQGVAAAVTAPWPHNSVQGPTILSTTPTTSAANTAISVTLTGATGQRVCLRTLVLFASAAPTTPVTLTIQDAGTTVLNFGQVALAAALAPTVFTGAPLVCSSTANNLVINVGAAGAAITTTTSAIADRQ